MKGNIVFIMPLIIAANCFCQQTHFTQNLSREDYIKKSTHQKTAAWIMLGRHRTCCHGPCYWNTFGIR